MLPIIISVNLNDIKSYLFKNIINACIGLESLCKEKGNNWLMKMMSQKTHKHFNTIVSSSLGIYVFLKTYLLIYK